MHGRKHLKSHGSPKVGDKILYFKEGPYCAPSGKIRWTEEDKLQVHNREIWMSLSLILKLWEDSLVLSIDVYRNYNVQRILDFYYKILQIFNISNKSFFYILCRSKESHWFACNIWLTVVHFLACLSAQSQDIRHHCFFGVKTMVSGIKENSVWTRTCLVASDSWTLWHQAEHGSQERVDPTPGSMDLKPHCMDLPSMHYSMTTSEPLTTPGSELEAYNGNKTF